MREKARTFLKIAREQGPARAVKETARYLAPSTSDLPYPLDQRARFLLKFVGQMRKAPLSLEENVELLRRGFLPRAHFLYDFDTHGHEGYLPCRTESVHGWSINEPYTHWLNDKQRFYEELDERGFERLLPTVHGTVHASSLSPDDIVSVLEQEGSLVTKARKGGGGSRVHVCRVGDGGYVFDEDLLGEQAFKDRLASLDGYLVTEFCHQAPYAERFFPGTPNTIRVLTMNPTDGRPFVAGSIHRIGSTQTGTVDNVHQGGLFSPVQAGGEVGSAVRFSDWKVSRPSKHPDSGAPIEGASVPGWPTIESKLLDTAEHLPETPYVGWDIIVTGPGSFKIIEGNANTDADLLQAHEPLLKDPRAEAFYQEHGLI